MQESEFRVGLLILRVSSDKFDTLVVLELLVAIEAREREIKSDHEREGTPGCRIYVQREGITTIAQKAPC